jgi:hypothetical protein
VLTAFYFHFNIFVNIPSSSVFIMKTDGVLCEVRDEAEDKVSDSNTTIDSYLHLTVSKISIIIRYKLLG